MSRLFIVPVEGRLVRKLDGTALPAAGDHVEPNDYWVRRQKACDVRFTSPARAKASTKKVTA